VAATGALRESAVSESSASGRIVVDWAICTRMEKALARKRPEPERRGQSSENEERVLAVPTLVSTWEAGSAGTK